VTILAEGTLGVIIGAADDGRRVCTSSAVTIRSLRDALRALSSAYWTSGGWVSRSTAKTIIADALRHKMWTQSMSVGFTGSWDNRRAAAVVFQRLVADGVIHGRKGRLFISEDKLEGWAAARLLLLSRDA